MNWDEDFSLEDQQPKQHKIKQNVKKKTENQEFFQEEQNSKRLLPTINNRVESSTKSITGNRNSKRANPYAEKQKKSYGYEMNDFQQQQVPNLQIANKNIKQFNTYQKSYHQKKLESQTEEFYEQVGEDYHSKPSQNKLNAVSFSAANKDFTNDKHANYGLDFEEENYGQDFEEIQQQSKKKSILLTPNKDDIKNSKISLNNNKIPAKINVNQKKIKQQNPSVNNLNQQISKQKRGTSLRKSQSRKSVQLIDMKNRIELSKTKPFTNIFVPDRYIALVKNNFQSVDIQKEDGQKITKSNQKMRMMIKKLNDELNELISKNMLQMKARKNQKQQTVKQRLLILENQRKNNESAIDRMQYQMGKLQGRQGQLKQQQFYMMIQRNIDEVTNKIKESQKYIAKLKLQVSNGGKRLSKKQQQRRNSKQLHYLNISLIQIKKEDEKGQEKIKRLDEKMQELSTKCVQIQQQLRYKLNEADLKCIKLQSNQFLLKRFFQAKKRRQNARNHAKKLQSLIRTKQLLLEHEKHQIQINIQNAQSEIRNIHSSIVHSQSQSAKAFERVKKNTKTSMNLITTLQGIIKSLQINNQFDPAFLSQTIKSPITITAKPLNTSEKQNSDKDQEKFSKQEKQLQINDPKNPIPLLPAKQKQFKSQQINKLQKPNLFQKKIKQEDLSLTDKKNETYGRIWKEQDQSKYKQQLFQKRNAEVLDFSNQIVEQKLGNIQKPFALKRNKNSNNKINSYERVSTPIQTNRIQKKQQEEIKQNDHSSVPVAPRMMKFKRRNQQVDQKQWNDKQIKQQIKNISYSKQNQSEKKDHQAQTVFVPKRFNLRNRNTVQKEQDFDPTINSGGLQSGVKDNNQDRNQINFKQGQKNSISVQQHVQNKNSHYLQNQLAFKQDNSEKPTFNLRLKDRKINRPQIFGEEQRQKQQKIVSKIQKASQVSQAHNKQSNNNPKEQTYNVNNPYAGGQQKVHKKREGPIKKTRLQSNEQQKKLKLFEDAQELAEVNQFVNNPIKQGNLSLNDMLGLKNNKNIDSMQDLLVGNNNSHKKQKKKPDDFFLDL